MTTPLSGPMGSSNPQQPTPLEPPPRMSSKWPMVILLLLALFALLVAGGYYAYSYVTHLPPTSVAGTWELIVTDDDTPANDPAEHTTLTLQQRGKQLTGVISTDQ